MSKIPNADRGVFASSDIPIGETIEECPFIEIPSHELENLERTVLVNYVYFFGEHKERALLALGFGSLYNHSDSANAAYIIKPTERVITFTAIKNIKRGKEITVNYIQGSGAALPLWFRV